MVELRTVAPAVEGSNPSTHPKLLQRDSLSRGRTFHHSLCFPYVTEAHQKDIFVTTGNVQLLSGEMLLS